MALKIIIALSLAAVVSAGLLPVQQQYHVAQPVYSQAEESYDPHPKYQFAYAVKDEHTGDIKNQAEARDGDAVHGEYSLIDSDGYKRTVQYTADHEHGFNAVVHREPLGHAVKVAPIAYAAAPAYVKSAPIAYVAGHGSAYH